jgi:hypothetical protein
MIGHESSKISYHEQLTEGIGLSAKMESLLNILNAAVERNRFGSYTGPPFELQTGLC